MLADFGAVRRHDFWTVEPRILRTFPTPCLARLEASRLEIDRNINIIRVI